MDASGDREHAPDQLMHDGDRVAGPGWTLEARGDPRPHGQPPRLRAAEENALFSGDHVMAWSTTVVAPPDGAMADYMASLAKLRRTRPSASTGRGMAGPCPTLRASCGRCSRIAASVKRRSWTALAAGDETIAAIVPRLYDGLAPCPARRGGDVRAGASGRSGGPRAGDGGRPAVPRRALPARLNATRAI